MTASPSFPPTRPDRALLWIALLGGLGLLGFMILSAAVINTRAVLDLDARIAEAVHDLGYTPLTRAFDRITMLGGEVLYPLGFGVGLALIVRRAWPHLAAWTLAAGGGNVLNVMLKHWFERPRPDFPGVDYPASYGYPSGHTMGAVLLYGMLAVLLWRVARSPLARLLILDLAVTLVLLVGFSRIILNVHFLSDVIGGLIAGGLWLALCADVLRVLIRARARAGEAFPPGPRLL